MNSLAMLAAGGGEDLLVGMLIGCCLGILIGPGFRAWQTHKEWVTASEEAQLTDRLLTRLEADASEAIVQAGVEGERSADTNGHHTRRTWRTSH